MNRHPEISAWTAELASKPWIASYYPLLPGLVCRDRIAKVYEGRSRGHSTQGHHTQDRTGIFHDFESVQEFYTREMQ